MSRTVRSPSTYPFLVGAFIILSFLTVTGFVKDEHRQDSLANQLISEHMARGSLENRFNTSRGQTRALIRQVRQLHREPVVQPSDIPGSQGQQGVQGVQGIQGPRGPRGAMGRHGLRGADGPIGPIGPIGATGATGLPGEPGPKGDPGDQGLKGDPGAKGDTGSPGPACPDGYTGQDIVTHDYTTNPAGDDVTVFSCVKDS